MGAMSVWEQVRQIAVDSTMATLVKVFITFPVTLVVLDVAIRMGVAEMAGYNRPTRGQTLLLAAAIVLLS